jgi:DNA-binding NarL/FixJ family response regulator
VAVVQVLVVDDQEPFREAAAAVIEATAGFAVAGVVGSGEESLLAATAHQVDLVLMDVNLPGIDGLTASARLRELADPPVVVLVSTHDEEEFADRLAEVGAVAYLSKSRLGTDSLARVWDAAAGDRSNAATTARSRPADGPTAQGPPAR